MEHTKYHMIPHTPSEDELKNIFASMLHTESRENVTENILQCLKNWENE